MSRPAPFAAALVIAGLILAGCSSTASSTAGPSAPAGGSPSADVPPSASPRISPGASPTEDAAGTPCPVTEGPVALVSDRLTDVEVESGDDGGRVRFTFAPMDEPSPGGPPAATFGAAEPPFYLGESSEPLEVVGDRVVRLHMTGMLVYDEAGTPTYVGPQRLDPSSGPVRMVAEEEAFEGVVNWLIGFDGPGCVTADASADGSEILVTVGPP